MTKTDAFNLQPGEVAIKLKKEEIQTIQNALTFQRDEIIKQYRRIIDIGIPHTEVKNLIDSSCRLTEIYSRLEESIL